MEGAQGPEGAAGHPDEKPEGADERLEDAEEQMVGAAGQRVHEQVVYLGRGQASWQALA